MNKWCYLNTCNWYIIDCWTGICWRSISIASNVSHRHPMEWASSWARELSAERLKTFAEQTDSPRRCRYRTNPLDSPAVAAATAVSRRRNTSSDTLYCCRPVSTNRYCLTSLSPLWTFTLFILDGCADISRRGSFSPGSVKIWRQICDDRVCSLSLSLSKAALRVFWATRPIAIGP